MRHKFTILWQVVAIVSFTTHCAAAQADLIVKVSDPTSVSALVLREAASKQENAPLPQSELMDDVLSVSALLGSVGRRSTGKQSVLGDVYRITTVDSTALALVQSKWALTPQVEYAIFNHTYQLERSSVDEDYDDTHFDSLTHLPLIRATEAWETTRGAPSVRIGVIDTGVFKEHPDLLGQFWVNDPEDLNGNGILDESDLNGLDDDANGYIDDVIGYDFVDRTRAVDQGDYLVRDPDASEDQLSPSAPRRRGFSHGTFVAGVIAAALDNGLGIAGVAPGARLVPIRAFGIDGLAEDDDIAAAIVYAADIGLDVVNLSFGDTYYSPLMADAIRYATSVGTTVVASGGNVGTDEPHYPSDYPESIGALWLGRDGLARGSRASFGIGVDVGAPASFVYTTLMPAPEDFSGDRTPDSLLYGYRSGSSMAAPQISGAVALLRSLDPTLSPASMKAILTSTALDLGEPGWDHETAAGRLDIAAAMGLPYPASVSIAIPLHNAGFSGGQVFVSGSVIASLFESYSLWYGIESSREEPDWNLITGPLFEQRRLDTLGLWDISTLPDTSYILRLEVTLANGQTIEDRRRIHVDHSPPDVSVIIADAALNGASAGIQLEILSDDLSDARMSVDHGGKESVITSDRTTRRHGHSLTWVDTFGDGGRATVTIEVSNTAGLTTTLAPIQILIPSMPNPGYLNEIQTGLPAGYLLPHETDLDADGLPEVVFNRYREGWLGDTVRVAEWAGTGFRIAGDILSNTFPRDIGDTDSDGNPEILLQVSAVTQVIEFSNHATEIDLIFIDTAGIENPGGPDAAWGALLTDLDADGLGEIVVHNRKQWRLLEYRPSGYIEVARLDNPTPIAEANQSGLLGTEANGFAEPQGLAGDFDGDGRGDLLVSDSDGDFIIFEAVGDDSYAPAWHHLTPRFNSQGTRLAAGDFDGDGRQEFVGYTHPWPDQRLDGEYDAPYGVYYFFESFGDNDYRITDSLVVTGEVSNHGSIAAIDFDGDDADEVVIAHPPNLYVVKPDPDRRWNVLFHRGDLGSEQVSGVRSIAMVPGDFDLDGIPEILVSGADEMMHRFEWSSTGTRLAPTAWVSAIALDAETVSLAWKAGQADSVAVYRRLGDEPYDLVGFTQARSMTDSTTEETTYILNSYYGSQRASLSNEITVRPHDRVRLVGSEWRDDFIAFIFEDVLQKSIEKGFVTLSDGRSPESAFTAGGRKELVLRFEPAPAGGDSVSWEGLVDAEGTPLADNFGLIPVRPLDESGLFLTGWDALSTNQAALRFNLELDPEQARRIENYRVDPTGSVVGVEFDLAAPNTVVVDVMGRALGPTGLQTSIVVLDMKAEDGTGLASEGTVATFLSSATSLSQAYVFPNPYRANLHGSSVMIAGLPNRSTIEIFSSTGKPVRMLEELDGDGGTVWDLLDDAGTPVSSGVYIIRVEAESEESVLLKSAVIR
jgi:hypothetical protein